MTWLSCIRLLNLQSAANLCLQLSRVAERCTVCAASRALTSRSSALEVPLARNLGRLRLTLVAR